MPPKTIFDLEIEILANVFQLVDDSSPHTTANIARVCTSFNSTLQLIRRRQLTVEWDEDTWVDRKGHRQEEWETPVLLVGLRELTVCRGNLPYIALDEDEDDDDDDDDESDDDDNDEDRPPPESTTIDTAPFSHLESVLRNATRLESLIWRCGYL
jgi:hypothetical protein